MVRIDHAATRSAIWVQRKGLRELNWLLYDFLLVLWFGVRFINKLKNNGDGGCSCGGVRCGRDGGGEDYDNIC